MRRILILSTLVFCGFTSCDEYDFPGMIKGSSPASNERFAVSDAYNRANGFRQIPVNGEEYTFYAAADAHVSTSAEGLSRFVSDYVSDTQTAPFALFTGDAMDRKNNFSLFLDAVRPISENGRTLFCSPGNHDLYFGQWRDYIGAMKTASYYFEVINSGNPSESVDMFICLDSASGTLGTDQRDWLESVLISAKGNCRHIVIFTHTHFFKRDNSQGHTSNFNLEESYDLINLFSDSGVDLVISGHDHFFEDTWFKNVHFITLAAIDDRAESPCYYTFHVTADSISLNARQI